MSGDCFTYPFSTFHIINSFLDAAVVKPPLKGCSSNRSTKSLDVRQVMVVVMKRQPISLYTLVRRCHWWNGCHRRYRSRRSGTEERSRCGGWCCGCAVLQQQTGLGWDHFCAEHGTPIERGQRCFRREQRASLVSCGHCWRGSVCIRPVHSHMTI